MSSTKVMLIGGGGREHALAWKLSQSLRLGELLIAPGNPGTAALGRNVPVSADEVDTLIRVATEERVDLVVVGPEAPLAAGIGDALAAAGIACFGPTRAAAAVEASKTFAKSLMVEAGIPTARHQAFPSAPAALQFLAGEDWANWRVVKADGLHAGKGVVVAESRAEVEAAIDLLGADEPLVLEEPLDGSEISLLAFCDGRDIVVMPPAQDHKRLLDGDRGPNTGGMGAFAPVAAVADQAGALAGVVIAPLIAALAARGTPFVGVLFAGLMLTSAGPRVLEYNARWGDPEAQALLPLLEGDLIEIVEACLAGRLRSVDIRWRDGAALGVSLAAAGYPGSPRRGDPITLPVVPPHVHVFHSGTALQNGALVTAGGRVATVVGEGTTLAEARARTYAYAERVRFEGKQMRQDIGWRSLGPIEPVA